MTESERSQGRAQTACLALDGEGDDTLFIGDCGQSRAPVAGAKWVKGFVPCGLVGQSPAPSERNGNTEHVARTRDLRRIDKPRRARYTFDSSTADVKSNIGFTSDRSNKTRKAGDYGKGKHIGRERERLSESQQP